MQNYEDCLLSTKTFDIEQDFAVSEKMDHEKIHPTVYGLSSKVET